MCFHWAHSAPFPARRLSQAVTVSPGPRRSPPVAPCLFLFGHKLGAHIPLWLPLGPCFYRLS